MNTPAFERRGKWVVGALMIGILALTLIFLQQQFNQGDERRAIELLMSKPPGARWSIAQELDARSGQQGPQCAPLIVSSFAGTLEVRCNAGPEQYRFAVDLVRHQVVAADPSTQALLERVRLANGPTATVPDGGLRAP